jgi:hypothetical protein
MGPRSRARGDDESAGRGDEILLSFPRKREPMWVPAQKHAGTTRCDRGDDDDEV